MKILGSLALSLFVGVCGIVAMPAAASAQAPAPAAAKAAAGVQADTDRGVLPLSAYFFGIAKQLPVGVIPSTVPKVKALKSFSVNVPGIAASNASVYWVNGLTEIWSTGQQALKATVTNGAGGGFSLAAPELAQRKNGFAMLVITDPGGKPPKFYAVQLSAK